MVYKYCNTKLFKWACFYTWILLGEYQTNKCKYYVVEAECIENKRAKQSANFAQTVFCILCFVWQIVSLCEYFVFSKHVFNLVPWVCSIRLTTFSSPMQRYSAYRLKTWNTLTESNIHCFFAVNNILRCKEWAIKHIHWKTRWKIESVCERRSFVRIASVCTLKFNYVVSKRR